MHDGFNCAILQVMKKKAKKEQPPRKQWFPRPDVEDRASALDRAFRPEFEGILETELGNGWMMVEVCEIHEGRRVIAELRICPAPPELPEPSTRAGRMRGERSPEDTVPAGGITARLLRHPAVKVGKFAEPVIEDHRRWVQKWFGLEALKRLDESTVHPSKQRKAKKKPRASHAKEKFYAKLAQDYVAFLKRGVKAPTSQLAMMRGVDIKTIRSQINLARRYGFLTKTSRGKAGGELTELAGRHVPQTPILSYPPGR